MFYSVDNLLGRNVLHAGEVSALAGLVAIDAAWTAGQVNLDGILLTLVPSQESCIGMCRSPYADYGRSGQ